MAWTDALRDASRTEAPILIAGPGGYRLAAVQATNQFQSDALFSYQPTPGTVVFFGYSPIQQELRPFRFSGLTRLGDSFFGKLSYTFRP